MDCKSPRRTALAGRTRVFCTLDNTGNRAPAICTVASKDARNSRRCPNSPLILFCWLRFVAGRRLGGSWTLQPLSLGLDLGLADASHRGTPCPCSLTPAAVGPGVAEHNVDRGLCLSCGSSYCTGFPSTTRSVDIPGATGSADHGCWGARMADSRPDRTLQGFGSTTRGGSNQWSARRAPSRPPCQRADTRYALSRAAQKSIRQTRTQPAPARKDAAGVGGDSHGMASADLAGWPDVQSGR